MSPPTTISLIPIILILLLLLLLRSANSSPLKDAPTAYELVEAYNFPRGLLPKGVVNYDLDRSTGKFHAYLNSTCAFSLEGSYQLKFRSTISGYITNNRLINLSGISVKVLFLWLNIGEVDRRGDELDFSVGIASACFPIDNFFKCPQCGCGVNCVAAGEGSNLGIKSSVSSF